MTEETVNDTPDAESEPTTVSETGSTEGRSNRPNAYSFAGVLFGGWAALMILFTLIAVVAMTLVGAVAG